MSGLTDTPTCGFTAEEIRRKVDELGPWFHNLDLCGVETAPDHFLGNYPSVKWRPPADVIPTDLTGETVLDIGCNAGFFSIEMKKRGAARVDHDGLYLEQAEPVARVSGTDIEFRRMSVYNVGKIGERFDIVIFMGVLYHLRHPLPTLDLIHRHVANDVLIFQSMLRGRGRVECLAPDYSISETAIFNRTGFPVMYFIENRHSGDPMNWWIPNRACVEALLRSSGFEIISNSEEEIYVCRKAEPGEQVVIEFQ